MQVRKRFAHSLYKKHLGFLIALASLVTLHAQKISFDNHTLKTGLPQNTVNDIVQDSRGFIWFATQVGAARYDGYTYEHFNISSGLPDDEVNCMLVDSEGKIWFGTEGGIGVYDGENFTTYTKEDGLIDNRTDGLIEDLEGNVWAWTAYGISVFTSDTIWAYSKKDALTDNEVTDVFVDSRGRVHMATWPKPGITIFSDPVTFEKLPLEEIVRDIIEASPGEVWYATQGMGILVKNDTGDHWLGAADGLDAGIILSMLIDSGGKIWCGTYSKGIYVYDQARFSHMDLPDEEEPIADELYEDSHRRIWIKGFNNGVWMLDRDLFKHYTVDNNLVNNDVTTIFEDRFRNIWFATTGGASKFGRAIFEIYDLDFGLPSNSVQSVFCDSRERIWFGANDNLQYISGDDLVILGEEDGFPWDAQPFSFAEDEDQNIYIGTGQNLFCYNGLSVTEVGVRAIIKSLLYTDDGQLWCATDSGVHILKDGKVSMLGIEDGLVNLQVNSLLQVGNVVYCATEGGLSLFDLSGQHLRNYIEQDGLSPAVYLDVTSDSHQNLWVATKSRGVSKINPGIPDAVENYNTSDGLVSNSTYFVEFADSVSLWIGTNRGINVLNIETGEIDLYGYNEGFYPLETYARAISHGSGGELWIGTIEGLVHYDPRYDVRDSKPPVLVLYPPLVNGLPCTSTDPGNRRITGMFPGPMTFPYVKNSLEFNFTGIHTTNPSRNSFSWYLEGFDDGWSPRVNQRTVPYMRLPNGHYVFHVRAYNLDGVEVEHEASFEFTIRPPFWKTYWFIILMVLTGLALIFSGFKFRERQLIKEKRILEVKVKERTREIEDQKVEIEAQRDEISDQKSFVEAQRDRIILQNKEITDSIEYAKRIQHAVLPGKKTLETTLPEHFILFKPRDIVSGDFYWMEKKEEQIVVCAADCTGHGVPGAFMSLLGLTYLNEIVNHEGVIRASEILNRLRKNIITSMSHKDETEQAKDGMDIVLVVIDRQLDMLEFSGAYNPLILVRNGEIVEYKGDKMPVGKHIGEERPFTNHRIQIEQNDMFYLYSDGFPDQFGGEKGGKYKARPFKNFLARISSEPVKNQAVLLEEELKRWMGEEPQVDDVLVIGIRYVKQTK
jgi:ligand-binding sensor domain-containing protein/serine phosphatase RsbU (regulator of sigma subunit)